MVQKTVKYDYIVAGAGLSGSVYAREMAERGYKVLVIERRNHIAGNLYDERDEEGFLVQRYGPHIFHTSNEMVHKYVQRFAEWKDYTLRCEAVLDGVATPTPFNFKTIDQFYNPEKAEGLKKALLEIYPNRATVTIVELLESANPDIKTYAQMLFDKDYCLYTAKQWGIRPQDIDVSVLKRVPVRLDYEERYFTDLHEYLPAKTYTDFISNLLNHPNIEVHTNEDVLKYIKVDSEKKRIEFAEKMNASDKCVLVFTGAIDELFGYKYGQLPYRSLCFKYEHPQTDSFQDAPVVAYPAAPDFTRITEYTKLPFQKSNGKTVVAYEYPLQFKEGENAEPYYPIPTEESAKQYRQYKKLAELYNNLVLCGRLADYKYYNMDQAIQATLEKININYD